MTRLRLNWRVKSAVLSLTPILAVLILGFVNLSTPQISDPTTPAAAAQQLSASQASPSEDFHSFTVSVQKNTEPTAPQPSTVTTTITTSQSSQITAAPQAIPTPTPIPSICPANPLDHVYTPSRLQLINPCLTVTGRIESIHPEFDGDFHIGLRLDPQFTNLVNDCNRTCLFGLEKGRLIVEVVCVFHPIFPAAARQTCEDYRSPVAIPWTYGHVSVTGAYVKDLDHGWMEIHPAWQITTIP